MTAMLRVAAADRRLLPEGRITGPMPWMIAIMMFLTVLAGAGGLGLSAAARSLGSALSNRVTVQIVEANPDRREAQSRAALATLTKLPGVRHVRRISDAEMSALLTPWLGAGEADADLPMPVLIDADLDPADASARATLATALARAAPAARIDDHAQTLGSLSGLIATLKWLAFILVLLMTAATACSVVLAARAALNTHRATIDVMHLLGATDLQISRLFQRRIALDALFGGLAGLIGGLAVIWLVGARTSAIGSELLGSVALSLTSWGLLLMLPLAGSLLAMVAARLTVVDALRKIL